jgi:hypothetical protein
MKKIKYGQEYNNRKYHQPGIRIEENSHIENINVEFLPPLFEKKCTLFLLSILDWAAATL